MSSALHRAAPRMFAALSALAFLSLLSCGREVTGPEARRMAMLALAPEFSGPISAIEGAGDAVPFERVRVLLRRDDGSIIKDTVVDFPSTAESISLTLSIPIPQDAPAGGLPLTVAMAYVNAAGDTVFRGGPSPLVARPVGTPGASDPVNVPVTWDGPGKDAARVLITPKSGNAVAGQTTAFAASAFDNADQIIANTPFVFSSVDTTRAIINPVTGVATWRAVRGTARVVAQLPNGLRADTATFTVALPASKLVLATGNAQTGAVNAPLADTIVLRTLASDDVPVEGVIVSFAVATGGGTLSVTTDTSDFEGKVKTRWTLGGTLGAQTITATAPGLTGSPLTVSATATAATPVRLEIQAQPSTGVAGAALAPALTVIARDGFGNAVPAFTDSVVVSVLGSNPPPVAGTLRRVPVAGTAAFNDLSLTLAGDVRFIVSSGALAPDTTTAITIAPAAAAALAIVAAPPASVAAGGTFGATVRVRDAFGNLVPTASEPIAVSFDAAPAGASFLGGDAPIAPTLGVVTFPALRVDRAGTYRLRFTSGTLTAAVTTDIVVGAAAADTVFAQAGNAQTATAGTLLPTALAVAVRDTFNNPVPGVSVAWTVTSGSGSVDSATSTTDASGLATVRWTLGGTAGAQTLRATVSGLPPVDFSATALAGTPAQVVFTQAPTSGSVADSLLPAPVVEIRDAFGNRITTYTGNVSIAFGSNPTGATLLGTTTVSAVAGIATFNDLRIQVAGSGYTLVATAVTEALASAPTAAFGRTPGVAADFAAIGGDAQTVVAGAPLALPFQVRLRDAFGNALANQAVHFTREAALASISDTLVLTDVNGVASITGVAGTTAGSGLLATRASVAGIATPLTFTATVTPGVATVVTFISQPDTAIAGDPLPLTLFVEFRDAFGNRVATLSDSVTMSIESGPAGGALLPATLRTQFIPNGGGPAGQFPGLEIEVAGTYVLRATTLGGLTGLSQPLVVVPNSSRVFTLVSGNNDTSAVNQPFGAPLRVRVTDSLGNPILGAVTTWTVPSGGATLAADTVLTDAAGYAQNTATHSGTVTALGTIAANLAGIADTREFFYTTTAAAATQLVVTTQPPVTTTAGASFNVAVEARDAFGNRDLTYADSTVFVINSGSVGATLSGVTRRQMVQGRVEFTGLSVDFAGDYTFLLSAPGLATTVTDTMRVTAAAAANVALASVSNDAQIGVAGDTLLPFRVRVTDTFGNPVSGVTVTWTETSGGSFVNPTSVTNASGEAESRAVAPLRTGLATFLAEVSGVPGSPVAFSATLLNLPPSELAIMLAPPASIPAGVALGDFLVRTQSSIGEPTAFTDTIRVAVVDGPVGGRIIAGDTAVLADSAARFTGITFDIAGNYTLEFRAAGLDSVRYVPINVVPGAVASLTPFSGDGQSGAVTTTLSSPLVVEVRDAFGNLATGVDVQFAVASGDATLTVGLVTTDGNGRAAAGVVLGDTAGTVTVTASFDALTPATFTVTSVAGPPTTPIELTAPSSGTAGTALSAFQFALVDQFGNIATGYTGTATVSLQAFGTSQPPVIASGDTAAVVNGVATWNALIVTSAGQYRIIADFGGTLGTITSSVITIAPGAPSLLANLGGDSQSAGVTQPFANPLRAQVTDAWGNGVSGVSVNFNIISGLGSLSGGSVPTDSTGMAEVTATADTVAGPLLVGAFAAGLTPDSVLYALTVQPGVPALIDSIVGGGQFVPAGATSDTIRVRVVDVYRNPVPGVTVTFSTENDLTFSAATATTDASGFAAVTVTTAGTLGGLGFDADVIAQSLSAAILVNVVAGPAEALEIVTAPTTGTAGVALDPIVVRAVDAFGNLTNLTADFVYVVVDSGPSGATIGADTAVAPSSGVATFSTLATTTAGTYRLRAFVTVAGITEAITGNIVISAAGATTLAYVSGDAQSMPPNTTAADSLVVRVTDAFGNPVSGVPISWGVSVGTAVVSTATVPTDALGRSAITLTASQFAESGAVTAVNAGLTGSPVTFTYNTTAGAATRLAFAAEPSSVVAGGAQFFQVAARDAFGNTATAFTNPITISVDSGPASPAFTGTLTQAPTNGVADFADLVFQTAGNYRLRATAAGVTDTTSITFSVFVGDAAVLTVVSGDLQADTVGVALPEQLRVRLTDQFGNPVAGADIDWLVASGNASLGFATTATDANGEASNGVQLGTLTGAFSVLAVSAAANDSVLFNGTTLPGAPARVAVVSRPDTLQALTAGAPFVIELRDAFNNLSTLAADTVFLTVNDGPPGGIVAGDTAVAPIAGVATFGNLQFGPTGTYILQFGINAVIDTLINLEVIAGEPTQIQQIAGMGQTAFATLALDTAFTVRVRDAANNPVPGVTVTWTVLAGSGGGLIDGAATATSVTDVNGQASAFFTPGTTIGTQTVRAEVAAVSVDFDVSVSELIGNSVWTGNVSTDWATPGNWINGQVPFAGDSVLILAGRARYPVLAGDVAMSKLWVEDGVDVIDVSNHNVLVGGNIRMPDVAVFSVTSGTIRGVGSGTHTVSGTLPILIVENGSYSPVTPPGLAFTVTGDLVAQSNGRWVLAANDSVIVLGAFRTGTGGRLEQAAGSDLEVSGDVEFGGGVSDLVGGRLVVGGNFSTTGSEQAAFRATDAHTTQFVGGVQTISFQIPDLSFDTTCTASCFGRLLADSTAGSDTLRFLTDAKARDGFDINNRGLLATGRTLVNGNNPITRLRGDSTEIRILVIIDNMADIGASRVIDTLVAAGSGAFSTGLAVPAVIAGNFSLFNQHLSSMVVEGTLTVDGPAAIINESLLVRGSGRLVMTDPNDTLTVFGSATFNGSAQTGDLTNGVLRVRGAFEAGAAGFVAEGSHVTELFSNLAAPLGMTGAGFGAGQNRFATLVLNKQSGATVQTTTPIVVDGQLRAADPNQVINGTGSAHPITARGADIPQLLLNNQPLVLVDGADVTTLQGLTFAGFTDPGQAQLRIERSGGGIALASPSFDASAASPPLYLVADDVAAGTDTLVITVSNPTPTLNNGLVSLLNGARLVGWNDFPAIVWQGSQSNAWNDPLNWLQGRVPTAADSVIVPSLTPQAPSITSDVSVRSFIYQRLTGMTLSANLTVRNQFSIAGETPGVTCTGVGRITFSSADSTIVGGEVACPVYIPSGVTRTTGAFTADSLIIEGAGEFHMRDADVVDLAGNLRTADTGTLRMEGTTETLLLVRGDAAFRSLPTAGAMTGGTIQLLGGFTQDSTPAAFRPSTNARVLLSGTGNRLVQFAHADPVTGSYFGDLTFDLSGAPIISLGSDLYVQGSLNASFNAGGTLFSGTTRLLQSRGAEVAATGGLAFENVRWEIIAGDTLASALHNVTFTTIGGSALPQLRIVRDTGAVSLNDFRFDSTATAALYLRLEDSAPADGTPLQVTMVNPIPAFHGGAIDTLGGAQLLGWDAEPTFLWTGSVSNTWTDPGNWSDGVVPRASSFIVIPDAPNAPNGIPAGTYAGLDLQAVNFGVNLDGVVVFTGSVLAPMGVERGIRCGAGDTLVVSAAASASMAGSIRCPVRVTSGQAAATGQLELRNLEVVGGEFDVGAFTVSIDSAFVTGGSGTLRMQDPAGFLDVGRNAFFDGGNGAGQLTAGTIRTALGLLQGSNGAPASFDASGTHLVVINNSSCVSCGPVVMGLTFAGAAGFNDVRVEAGTVGSNGSALLIRGDLDLSPGTSFSNNSDLQVDGSVIGDVSTTLNLNLFQLQVGGAWDFSGTLTADTLVLTGSQALAPLRTYTSPVVLEGAVTLGTEVAAPEPYQFGNALTVRGTGSLTLAPGAQVATVTVPGKFAVEGNATLVMQSPLASLTVGDTAFFGGASTNGLLTAGTLVIGNAFVQTNATSDESFRATLAHVTRLAAGGGSTFARFQSPGAAGFSGFANLEMSAVATFDSLRLDSDVHVQGTMAFNVDELPTVYTDGTPREFRVGSMNLNGIIFDGVNVVLTNVTSEITLDGVRFFNQDPGRVQLEIIGTNAPVFITGATFTTVPTGGRYVRAEATAASTLDLFFSGTSPQYHAGFLETIGAVTVTGWDAAEPPNGFDNNFIGTGVAFWESFSNWSLGRVPTANDNVFIPAGVTVRMNEMDGGDTYVVRSLTIAAGGTLDMNSDTLVVRRDVSVAGTIGIIESPRAVLRMVPTAETPVTLGGGGAINGVEVVIAPPTVGADSVISLVGGGITIDRSLWVAGGRLDLNGQTLVTDTLITTNTGRISMLTTADSLHVNDLAQFGGASTEGLLTDGRLVLAGNFEQLAGVPQAFAANGNHRTLLTSATPSIFFNNPGPTASHFGSLQPTVEGTSASLASDVYVTTNLVNTSVNVTYAGGGANRLIQAGGIRNNGASTAFENVRLALVDGGSDQILNPLSFSSMDLSVAFLTVDRAGGTTTFPQLSFANIPTGTGRYLVARDTVDNGSDLEVVVGTAFPGGHGGFINTFGFATITGWDEFSLYVFTGAIDNSLGNIGNWSTPVFPTVTSNVRFDNALASSDSVVLSGQQYRDVTFAPGARVIVSGNVSARTVAFEGDARCTTAGGFSLSGAFGIAGFLNTSAETCGLTVASGSYFFGANAIWRSLRIDTGGQIYLGNGGTADVTVTLRDSLFVPTGGELYMDTANDTLTVEGLAVLQAGSVASLLDGTLNVWRGFFSDALIGGSTSTTNLYLGFPTIGSNFTARIGAEAGWGIDSVFLHDGVLTVQDSMYVRRHLGRVNAVSSTSIQGGRLRVGTTGDAPAHLLADGSFALGETDEISVDHLEVFGSLLGAGTLTADTVTFLGRVTGTQAIPADNGSGPGAASYNYGLIRVLANAAMQSEKAAPDTAYFISQGIEVRNGANLTISGTGVNPVLVSMPNGTLSVDGFGTTFSIDGSNVHVLVDSVFIRSDAQSVLHGSNTSLNIRSDLIAEGLNGFGGMLVVTSSEHVTRFIGNGITRLGNNSGNSNLGTTEIRGGTTRTLLSDLYVSTLGREGSTAGLITFQTPNPGTEPMRLIRTLGTDFVEAEGSVLMRNVGFLLRSTLAEPGIAFALDNVTFQQMDPTATFIDVDFDNTQNPTFNNITFDSPVTTGSYLSFDAALVTGTPSVSFVNATPSVGCLAGTCLPGNVAPDGVTTTLTFQGTIGTDWHNPQNWLPNGVPNASTDVIIPAGFSAVMFDNAQARSVTVQSGGTLFFTGGNTLNIWGSLQVDGTFGGDAGIVRMRHVAGGSTLAVSGSMAPALFVTGGVGGLEDVVTLSGNVTRTQAFGGSTTVEAGILDLGTHAYVDSLGFATVGTGRLRMVASTASLTAGQLLRFAGGSTDGLLTAGTITVTGSFEQQGSTGAFRAGPNLTTRFARNGPQSVTLASPGFGPSGSHFGDIELVSDNAAAVLQLNSNLPATGQLRTTAFGATNRIQGLGGNRLLQIRGAAFSDSLVLDGVKLRIDDGDAIGAMNGLRFLNLTENGLPALEIARAGGIVALSGATFDTGAGFTNNFLVARDENGGDGSVLTVDFGGTASPTFHAGRILLQNGALLNNWLASPPEFPAVWTGSNNNTDWLDAGNWLNGILPNASANVTINLAATYPVIPANTAVNDFTVVAGAVPLIADGAVLTVYGDLTVNGTLLGETSAAMVLMRPDVPVTFSALGSLAVPLEITSGLAGNLGVVHLGEAGQNFMGDGLGVGTLTISGSTLSIGNGTLFVPSSVRTQGNGRLLMSGTGLLATFGDAIFDGLQSDLTNGRLTLIGNLTQNATNSTSSFVSTGNHVVTFAGNFGSDVSFASSSPTTSRLGRVEFAKDDPFAQVNFASGNIYVERIQLFNNDIAVSALGAGAHLYVINEMIVAGGVRAAFIGAAGFMTFLDGVNACGGPVTPTQLILFGDSTAIDRVNPLACFVPS